MLPGCPQAGHEGNNPFCCCFPQQLICRGILVLIMEVLYSCHVYMVIQELTGSHTGQDFMSTRSSAWLVQTLCCQFQWKLWYPTHHQEIDRAAAAWGGLLVLEARQHIILTPALDIISLFWICSFLPEQLHFKIIWRPIWSTCHFQQWALPVVIIPSQAQETHTPSPLVPDIPLAAWYLGSTPPPPALSTTLGGYHDGSCKSLSPRPPINLGPAVIIADSHWYIERGGERGGRRDR